MKDTTLPDSELRYPKWQNPCVDAVMELDPSKLLERVAVAERAVYARLRELETSSDGAEERLAINDAMRALRVVTRDRLKLSDSMQRKRILFADDNDRVRNLIKRLLIESNPAWEIHEARTGKEAFDIAIFTKPDLVLVDINLPDMQGTEVARKIRKSLPSVKIVLCSLSDSSDVASQVKASGADAYISKLTPMEEFHKILAALIDTSQK